MKIEKAKQLTSKKFKRLTGVSRRTFEIMLGLVKADEQKKKKPGRHPRLIIERPSFNGHSKSGTESCSKIK